MITLRNLTLRRGARVLLEDASVQISPGDKIGLVGRNGAGKSSLFALFNGELHEDRGEFFMPPQWQLAQVAQHMPQTEDSATDFVLGGDTRLQVSLAELQRAEQANDGEAIGQAHAHLADAGAHDATARAQALLLGLGFKLHELTQAVNSFSGGWRMRLQLARALMCPADLLLLDEPTNHLDLDALVWLEAWLKRYEGTLLVISHDREFLDAVTRVTLHIDAERLTRYGGNYSAFEELRAQHLVVQQAAYAKQQARVAHLQKFIDRFKAQATKARQAQSRVKALERMERLAPVLSSADFQFDFLAPEGIPNPMLTLRDVDLGYPGQEDPATGADPVAAAPRLILRGLSRTVLSGQRIGILGANGQGKSTLVKTIARELQPLAGRVVEGKGLRIAYFAQQELDVLRAEDSALAHMLRLAREVSPQAREQELRNFLGNFRFVGDMVGQPVGTLSGGEKARLVLAMMVWQRPNLLLLDEPTNHLDLVTREALAMALNGFEGTVLLVSHDRALLRAVCDEFWLVAQGSVAAFDGDLDDYQRFLLDEAKRLREMAQATHKARADAASKAPSADASRAEPALNPRDQRKQEAQKRQQLAEKLRPYQRELTAAEQRMETLEAEQQALEAKLGAALNPSDIAEAGRRLKALHQERETLEERWLSLCETIENLQRT